MNENFWWIVTLTEMSKDSGEWVQYKTLASHVFEASLSAVKFFYDLDLKAMVDAHYDGVTPIGYRKQLMAHIDGFTCEQVLDYSLTSDRKEIK